MLVYKLTCDSGKVYYGSTKDTLENRAKKGWYNCSCRHFYNSKMEVVEFVSNHCDLLKREAYYISNFDCVNKTLPYTEGVKNPQYNKKYRKKILDSRKYTCSLCSKSNASDKCLVFESKHKLNRHLNGSRHQAKQASFKKYGKDWKKYYLNDNKKRYYNERKIRECGITLNFD